MSTDRAVEAACRANLHPLGEPSDTERAKMRRALAAAYPDLVAEVDLKLQTMVRELLAEDSNEFTKGKITGLGYARQFLAAAQLERGR